MRIIMLSGPQNSGKTTTINMVYDAIISASSIYRSKQILGGDMNDFEAVLDYIQNGQTKRVAFFSMGDYSFEVVHAMSFYEGMGCDVLICTCRDYFSYPFQRLEARYDGIHPPIPKNFPNDLDNKRAMNEILALI